jgi:hypothetical protein
MKTKELIALLQKKDPDGECHIRINEEPIFLIDEKEGYWDGSYSYLEKAEDGKLIWVQSSKGHKIDIDTIDLFDFAEIYNGNWEKMKNHIRVEYDYHDNGIQQSIFMAKAQKECEEYNRMTHEYEEKNKKGKKKFWIF